MPLLEIKNLHVVAEENTPILHGINLRLDAGETAALMGPNGSGKSTLASVLMGSPAYRITQGHIRYQDQDLTSMSPEERAKAGLFLSFQYPQTIAGVSLRHFLRLAYNATHATSLSPHDFTPRLQEKCDLLGIPHEFLQRSVNEGMSGGEKKRAEMLQLAVLEPQLAILDETDSGLDIDALKVVAQAVTRLQQNNPALSVLIITHYQRLLNHVPTQRILILKQGRLVREGNHTLLPYVEQHGYQSF
jgi:Fe-S cluster assembly ATP-binding protein